MGEVAQRLAAAGYSLPEPPTAVGKYLPAKRAGSFVFTSGQLPVVADGLLATGSLAREADVEKARACAEVCALNALAAASTVCDLDDVRSVVKVVGYVSSDPDFTQQPAVVNGASELLSVAFGEAGRHAREAVGVASLPLGAPVEVSVVLELAEDARWKA